MALTKIEYGTGDTLTAEQLNEIQDAIIENQDQLDNLSIADIGAAPSGFVSKNYTASSELEIDNAITETWSLMGNDCIKFISIYISVTNLSLNGGVWFLQISKQTNDYGSIIAHCFGNNGVRKMVRTKYGTWQPWEWENPPMGVGVEYRTTERWQSKPVYVKIIDFGTLPNNNTKTKAHNIANVKLVIDVFGQTSYASSLHYIGVTSVYCNPTNVSISTNTDLSGITAYVAIKYTKTTD